MTSTKTILLYLVNECQLDIWSFDVMMKLKLNPDKTEFLLIGIEQHLSKYLSMFPIELFGIKTNPAKSAQNLGVIFDKYFTIHSNISAHAFCRILDLRRSCHYLDLDSAKLLANALVSSHLDSCNSLLCGIADTDLTKLNIFRIY